MDSFDWGVSTSADQEGGCADYTPQKPLTVWRTSGYAQSYLSSEVKLEGGVYDTYCVQSAPGSWIDL